MEKKISMATIVSINVSGSGGVPKLPLKTAIVRFEGVEGDLNRFRMERKKGDPRKGCVHILHGENIAASRRGASYRYWYRWRELHYRRDRLAEDGSWYDD